MNRLLHIAALALSLLSLGTGCLAESEEETVEQDVGNLSAGRSNGDSSDEDTDDGANSPPKLPFETGGPRRDPCQGCGPGPQPWQTRGLSSRPPY